MQEKTDHKYIYSFKYDVNFEELSKLEMQQVFGEEAKNKFLFSNIEVSPSLSPFVKSRFDIWFSTKYYSDLLKNIETKHIQAEGFKAEYLVLEGDPTTYKERLNKLRDIGYRVEGEPDYRNPSIIYSLCYHQNTWYFGVLAKHNPDWQKHKRKPRLFSNSIDMTVAKVLVNLASKADKSCEILDACCGVGTIMLEACWAGFQIEGCDINEKNCQHTEENLKHFNYTAQVHCSDIQDLAKNYDAAIIDLPYNLYSHSDEENTLKIISSVANLAPRIIIVSTSDISTPIQSSGLAISELTSAEKKGKARFKRKIWICERKA